MKYACLSLLLCCAIAGFYLGTLPSNALAGETPSSASAAWCPLVVVGTISDIDLRVITISDRNRQFRSRYYDVGWIEVEEVLKGHWRGPERIPVMLRSEVLPDSLFSGSPAVDPVTVSDNQRAIWTLYEAMPPFGVITHYVSDDMHVIPVEQKNEVIRWCYDTPPLVIEEAEPEFPEHHRDWGITDDTIVKVRVLVGVDGEVIDAEVQYSFEKMFNESVLSAVKKYRFEPAELAGKKVQGYRRIDIRF